MASLKENLEFWIKRFAEKENLNDYMYSFGKSNEGGSGFCGNIAFISLKAKKDGKEIIYNLVIKSALNNATYRRIIPIHELYVREIRFYMEIMPALLNNLKENLVKGNASVMYKIPTCFYVLHEKMKECLILDNMEMKEYHLQDRKKPMDLNHALMVVKSYAHLHGLSYVYKAYHPVRFDEYARSTENMWGIYFDALKVAKTIEINVGKIIKYLQEHGYENIANKYKDFEKKVENIMINLEVPNNNPSIVITHGDCWTNNLMFKYAEEDKKRLYPTDVCLLDFQFHRMASPVFDLSHFLYTSTDHQVLKHFDLILDTYHSTLTDFLSQFNCDVKDFLSFDDLWKQFGLYGKYGVCFASFMMRVLVCDVSELVGAELELEKYGSYERAAALDFKDGKTLDTYFQRMKDVYIHYAENFL